MINATNNQIDKIDQILFEMLHHADFDDKCRREIKQFEIRECGKKLSVMVEVGMPGDEGTMASVLCRDRCHVFVGIRGGMRTYRRGHKRQTWVKLYELPYLK